MGLRESLKQMILSIKVSSVEEIENLRAHKPIQLKLLH